MPGPHFQFPPRPNFDFLQKMLDAFKVSTSQFPNSDLWFYCLFGFKHTSIIDIKQHNQRHEQSSGFSRFPRFFSSAAGRKTYRRSPESSNCHGEVNRLCPREIATTRTINSDGKFFKMDLPKPKRRTFCLSLSANRHHTIHKQVDNVMALLRQPPFISKCSSPSLGSFKFVKGAMQEIKYIWYDIRFILSSNWTNLIRHAAW